MSSVNLPLSKHFVDDEIIMKDADGQPKVALSMGFYPEFGQVSLICYDYVKREDQKLYIGLETALDKAEEQIDVFLSHVIEEYGFAIPKSFYELPLRFSKFLVGSFTVNESLDEPYECEGCFDVNENIVQAFYFPAVDESEDASLSVFWEAGCYGGESVAGAFTDVKSEAIMLLQNAVEGANPAFPQSISQVEDFIIQLEAL